MTITINMTFNSPEEAMDFLALKKVSDDRRRLGTTAAPAKTEPVKEAPAAVAEETTPAKPAKAAKAAKAAPVAAEEDDAPAAVAEETTPAKPAKAAKAVTSKKLGFQDIRDIISKHTEVHGLEASKTLLGELGFVKASGIPEEQYATVYAKFEEAIDA